MNHLMNEEIPNEAIQALAVVKELLGDTIIAVHLFGSAVHGGLRTDSDVDVLVIVNQDLSEDTRKKLTSRLMRVSGKIGNTVSLRPLEVTIIHMQDVVPWRYPPKFEFLYGEWMRSELEKGHIPEPAYDPDLAVVLAQARINSIPLFGADASVVLEPIPITDIKKAIYESLPVLVEGLKGDERNVVLTLARMWQTMVTGEIHPKDVAAAWAEKHLPTEQAMLLDSAGKAYRGECTDKWEEREGEVTDIVNYMRNAVESQYES